MPQLSRILFLASLLAFSSQAAQVVLSPSADATLFESSPDNNLGATSLSAGATESFKKSRAVIQFDIPNSIPTNATVTSVSLAINVVRTPNTGGTGSTFRLYRLLKSWGEGNKGSTSTGSAATTGECSWKARFAPSTLWTTAGAAANSDYVSTSSASTAIDDLGTYTFASTANLVADVQLWKNSNTNFGWILISDSEGTAGTARRFGYKEDPGNSSAQLTIDYTVPAPPASPTISSVTRTNNQFRFTFNGAANQAYTVQSTLSLSPTNWTTFSNVSAVSVSTNFVITDSIGNTNKFYRIKAP